MASFPLKIVCPDGVKFDGQAQQLSIRTTSGELGILARHTDCVAPLGMGRATVIIGGTLGTLFGSVIRITLKYGQGKAKIIKGLRRVSKPGLRIYSNCEDMPKVMNGLGIAIVSTSKGIMTDKQARANNVGGEVLAFVW